MIRKAKFSPCRKWRYTLSIIWDEQKPYCQFIGLNPSTADEVKNDPTVTRCCKYSHRWGYGGLVMTNLFGWRDTDPRGMLAQEDPVGPGNDAAIIVTAIDAGIIVAAWGAHGAHMNRGAHVISRMHDSGITPHALKLTKGLHPAHPLYLRADLGPKRYSDLLAEHHRTNW